MTSREKIEALRAVVLDFVNVCAGVGSVEYRSATWHHATRVLFETIPEAEGSIERCPSCTEVVGEVEFTIEVSDPSKPE